MGKANAAFNPARTAQDRREISSLARLAIQQTCYSPKRARQAHALRQPRLYTVRENSAASSSHNMTGAQIINALLSGRHACAILPPFGCAIFAKQRVIISRIIFRLIGGGGHFEQ